MYATIIGHNNKEIFQLNNCKLNIDIKPIIKTINLQYLNMLFYKLN